jgi:hypothetical protein
VKVLQITVLLVTKTEAEHLIVLVMMDSTQPLMMNVILVVSDVLHVPILVIIAHNVTETE